MLFPDVETLRRDAEVYEVPDYRTDFQSNLERNCGQIFVRGPALTKDFLEKVNSEIVPQKTYLFGRVLNTKNILFISGLFLLLFLSLFGVVVMWFTEYFDNVVLSRLVMSNTSEHLKMWSQPSPRSTVSMYIFNYTNLEEYNDRMQKKLRVQEVGPYVYEETLEKVNLIFDDDTVSYQEKRTYKFLPKLSKGRQSDRVNVPNVPLLAGAAKTKHLDYFNRLAFTSFLTAMDQKAFLTLPADDFITGYPSDFYDISRSLSKFNNEQLPEKIGLLAGKSGVQPNVYTMNTGKHDLNKLGIIERINGEPLFDYWSTDECNSLQGSDGATFPPKLIQQRRPISILQPQLCRTIPLNFQKQVTILDGKIPAYRYVVPEDIFDSATEIPEHQCYCDMKSGVCPLKGVLNATPCNMGTPVFVSLPHFHGADPSILNGVSGLGAPNRDISSYLDLHPSMGFGMSGRIRVQMNVQVQKSPTVYQLNRYEDGLMLPLAWMEVALDDKTLPQDFVDIIYDATYTLKGVKLALQWGCLLTMLITAVCILLAFKSKWWHLLSRRNSPRALPRPQESDDAEI